MVFLPYSLSVIKSSIYPALQAASVFNITLGHLWRTRHLSGSLELTPYKKEWADELLTRLGITVLASPPPIPQKQGMLLVGNHISYLDILVLISQVPQVCFVSKAEVAKWPIIGAGAKKIGTVFVHRESKASKTQVRQDISKALTQEGKAIAIFPAGTTSIYKSIFWKKGAFEIAAENNIPILPFRIHYQPLRLAAYIDNDNLLQSLYQIIQKGPIHATVEFEAIQPVTHPSQDCSRIQSWCEEYLNQDTP